MSGALNYVLGRLVGRGAFDIPKQIIEVGFRDEWLDRSSPQTLESKILNWVIKERVIRDMDLVHGEEILIDLSEIHPYTSDDYAQIYNIPPELTNNREIVCVSSVSYVPFGQVVGHRGGSNLAMVPMVSNDLVTASSQLMNSVSAIPNMSTARADLVGYNVVRVTDRQRLQIAYVLRCFVTNDDYLANIVPRAYPDFAKLCILAVKAYLYNKLIVTMGDHFLQRGQELGVFKQVIEGYESANDDYHTFLREVWQGVAHHLDEDNFTRYLQFQIPTGL